MGTLQQPWAATVREAAGRILGGESLYGVRSDLNRREILTAPSPRAPQGARCRGIA